jgi:hypothetical protein
MGVMRRIPVLLTLLVACDAGAPDTGPSASGQADDLLRARAAAFFIPGPHRKLGEARDALAPLVARSDARLDDLLRGAIVEFHDLTADDQAGVVLLERAAALAPDDLTLRWIRGNYSWRAFELEGAQADFRFVVQRDPGDAAARLLLADVADALGDLDTAVEQYRAVRELGLGPNGPFYVQATYKLFSTLYRLAKDDAERDVASDLRLEYDQLTKEGIESADDTTLWLGRYGDVRPSAPVAVADGAPRAPDFGSFGDARSLGGGALGLTVADLDGDGTTERLAWGAGGVERVAPDGSRSSVTPLPATRLRMADLDGGDPDEAGHAPALELLVMGDGAATLLDRGEGGSWAPAAGAPLPTDATVHDGLFADLDHDGGLDVVLATSDGLRWVRHDAREDAGRLAFTDATPPTFAVGACTSVAIEDIDGNQAVDLVAVAGERLVVLAGLWGGVFEDRTETWGLDEVVADARTAAGGLWLEDLDADGRVDLLLADASGLSARLGSADGFSAPLPVSLDGDVPATLVAEDLDADGLVDLVGRDEDGSVRAWRGPVVGRDAPLVAATLHTGSAGSALTLADVDGDHALDLLLAGPDASAEVPGGGAPGKAFTLQLEGHKDNARGVGAIVDVLVGSTYRRIFWDGDPVLIGLGSAPHADVLFVRWPNGVHQRAFELVAGATHRLPQDEGLTGSCPFLYTWNGETYEFISDVLGTTPLGLPMTPDMMVPFDHDEWVRVAGDQLVPRNGRLDLVITEELREVTYLDRVELHAIDHPAGVEIQPNEAFTFPPFLPHHVHTLSDVRAPSRVTASTGEDVTELVSALDGRHARPFTHRSPRYRGLAEPWSLEIELAEDGATLAAAPRIRLALTGWLLWGDASVNMSAASHPDIAFEPPRLSVPDGDGWRSAGPPIGFIAGKTKTMLVDITDLVDPADPRIRLDTTLALSWDAIRVVLDDDDAPTVQTALEAEVADLAYRGFSARLDDPTGEHEELFVWAEQDLARWDQHPGRYTRYGDVLPLLGAIDDRYVIMGSGDALTLSFPADALPPLKEGWTRDWLLFLDGWAKDRDPNTVACRTVEPLPFHGMDGYPPRESRGFPATADELAWDAEWNTREAAVLVERLAARTR